MSNELNSFSSIFDGMEFNERLERLLRQRGIKPVEAARTIGVTRGTLSHWLRDGGPIPKGDNALKLAMLLGTTPDYLLLGKEPKQAGASSIHENPATYAADKKTRHIQVIGEARYPLPFNLDFLDFLNIKIENAAAVFVSDDSMAPTIYSGACVIVDTSSRKIKEGEIYAFIHDYGHAKAVRVKHLHNTTGGVRVRSKNATDYPDEFIPSSELGAIRIIGQARFIGSPLPSR